RATLTRAAPARAASGPLPAGTTSRRPAAALASATGSTPSTSRNCPVSASSPTNSQSSSACSGICPLAARIPSAIGRSNRPPPLGRSAGARLTVMRRAGNSSCAHWIAARTRSLASRTAACGRPTMDIDGSPPARWTSTRTSGARTPTRARLCTSARFIAGTSVAREVVARGGRRGAGLPCFQRGQLALELLELVAGARQHRALHLELLAGHQVELRQAGLQHGLEVLLHLLAALAQPGWDQRGQAAGEVVDVGEVDHLFGAPPGPASSLVAAGAARHRRAPRRGVGIVRFRCRYSSAGRPMLAYP